MSLARWILRLLIIILTILIERVFGPPIFSILLISLFATRLNPGWRVGLMLTAALVIAALYMWSLTLVVGVLGLSFLGFKYGKKIVSSQFLRLMMVGVLGGMGLIVMSGDKLTWQHLGYAFFIGGISFLGLKRRKLHLRT